MDYFCRLLRTSVREDSGDSREDCLGEAKTSDPWTGSDYYDFGTTWNDGTDRSSKSDHSQWLTSSFDEGVQTSFWFIQDTWYPDLEALSEDVRDDYDVLIANSGWWELKDSDDDGTQCEDGKMFSDPECLEHFEGELDALLLPLFAAGLVAHQPQPRRSKRQQRQRCEEAQEIPSATSRKCM